jgi:hypothetical protein
MPKGKVISTHAKYKQFAADIVSGKKKAQAYKDRIATREVSTATADANSSKLLKNATVQEEIARRLAEITPEDVLVRIDDLSRTGKPSDTVKLRALEMLGNTRKVNIFKDSTPTINNNTLQIIDVDDLRRRLAESTGCTLSGNTNKAIDSNI